MSLGLLVFAFAVGAAVVWWAGTQLPRYAVAISNRTGLGQAFIGMLLLGGITSLPELATATSAAALGASSLALNNILGSAGVNILLLAVADLFVAERPLTSVVARPATLIQGVLGMLLLAFVALAILVGERPLLGGGLYSWTLLGLGLLATRIAYRSDQRPMWLAVDLPDPGAKTTDEGSETVPRRLVWGTVGLAAVILAGGTVLAITGDAIAHQTGIGGGIVGLLFVAAATSLPEASAVVAATRRHRYELAVGEVFGSNLFNLSIIVVIDIVGSGPPVLATAGSFEAIAALVALLLSGIVVLGLVERRDHKMLRMGVDSFAVLLTYAAGMALALEFAAQR